MRDLGPEYSPVKCPFCDYELTGHAPVVGSFKPRSGDVSICIECGSVSIYQIALRKPTEDELESIVKEDPNIKRAQHKIRGSAETH